MADVPGIARQLTMGCFFFKIMTEKLKVPSPKKIKKSKYTHCQFRVRLGARKSAYMMYRGPPVPNVVGLTAKQAVRRITHNCPGLRCAVIRPDEMQTMCYVSNRVCLNVNRYNKVVRAPQIG
ncbi:hypothetical protein EJB05_18433, partial [Eragrostis curvula]